MDGHRHLGGRGRAQGKRLATAPEQQWAERRVSYEKQAGQKTDNASEV